MELYQHNRNEKESGWPRNGKKRLDATGISVYSVRSRAEEYSKSTNRIKEQESTIIINNNISVVFIHLHCIHFCHSALSSFLLYSIILLVVFLLPLLMLLYSPIRLRHSPPPVQPRGWHSLECAESGNRDCNYATGYRCSTEQILQSTSYWLMFTRAS